MKRKLTKLQKDVLSGVANKDYMYCNRTAPTSRVLVRLGLAKFCGITTYNAETGSKCWGLELTEKGERYVRFWL